jgi:hypothetical protein
MIWLNFLLHFIGPILQWEGDERFVRMFMINICAVLVLLGPLLVLCKDHFLKPGFVYATIMSGFLLSLYPGEALGLSPFDFSVLRIYFQHLLLFSTGALLLSLGHVKLGFKTIWTLPVFMFVALQLVVANGAILAEWGLIRNMRVRNMAFQWGPYELEWLVAWLIPDFLMTADGRYIPVFWQLPIYLTFYPFFGFIVNLAAKLTSKASN